jgi:release factor H-coupled RctB family protein
MGNHIKILSSRVNLIANSDTWIEGKAIQQLEKTAQLKGIKKATGMPDLHPGRGYPIGAAFLSYDRIYPALIGNDIGCGMSLWNTNIKARKVNLDKFEKKLSGIDEKLSEDWQLTIEQKTREKKIQLTGFGHSLGTIGGGNHFAELQQLEKIYNQLIVDQLLIDKNQLVLLVHSGSRGLGQSVLRSHVEQFGHNGLKMGTATFSDYIHQHDNAIKFAELNRELIAGRILAKLHAKGEQLLDVNHNLVSQKKVDSKLGWIHRKGATPGDCGLVMIPGSRGDYSYLVKPNVESQQWDEALFSLAHGAGRKWMRSECKDRLSKRYRMSDLERTRFGSRVICNNKDLIFEEAPEAYKTISSVIEAMTDTGLISLVARFKPVLTYKTKGAC